ncbi:hypothetical protein ACHAXM_001457 [Skeletonema potamos]
MQSSGGRHYWFCTMRLKSFICNIVLILTISTQQSSSSSLSSSRQLQDVDGVTACSGCTGEGLRCVGRTIDDTKCQACATGQTFWPCNLPKECWCYDTSGPRDPGDGTDGSESSLAENTDKNSTEADEITGGESDSTEADTPSGEDADVDPYINTDEEGKTPDTGTNDETIAAPTLNATSSNPTSSAPTQSTSEPDITDSPMPSIKGPTSPLILETDSPTLQQSLSPKTNEPSASPLTKSPTETPTEFEAGPTYMPTTPEPTLGPCGGLPCPDGLCRSAWNFCGDAEGYCNDSAIWSPTCPIVTAPPSLSHAITNIPAAPTISPIGTSTLNDVFGISDETDAEEVWPTPTPQPTMPTGSKPTSGPKPTGGKKPVGGKPLPTVKNSPPTTSPTPLPMDSATSAPPSTQQPTEEPTLVSNVESTGLSFPENTYFCGKNWQDVNESCSIRCPSSKTEDCPGGMFCFAFTKCNDNMAKDDANESSDGSGGPTAWGSPQPTLQETTPHDTSVLSQNETSVGYWGSPQPTLQETTPHDTSALPQNETSVGCTGAPCPTENQCRSEFGFCGTSFIYCNDLSSWTLDKCGLLGTDATGETHLCDVEVFECSNGQAVYRNPAEMCEYFQCPEDEDESAVFPSVFNVPGPSPLPPLPKPTLPTITKPTSSAFLPPGETSFGTVDESTPDSGNNLAVLLGNKNETEVADDKDQVEEGDADESKSNSDNEAEKPVSPSYDLGMFKAEEWLKNSSHDIYDRPCQLLISLAAVLLFIIH